MTSFTLAQIQTKLKYDLDIFDEDFVDLDTELPGYINEAIDDAESVIHTLYEDYFYVQGTITLVSGTHSYALPSDIFGHKIRGLFYNNGTSRYVITKIRKPSDTLGYTSTTTARYRYLITNVSGTGPRVKFYPTPLESGAYIECHYIRNAKRLALTSDECDIPEFINFIYAHVRYNLAIKEKLPLDIEKAEQRLLFQRALMEKTLTAMTVDEDSNRIEQDVTFYEDFDSHESI